MASRGCKHPADAFCYVCGQFIKTRAKKYSVEASAKMCEAYKAYFGMPVGDQDKPWAPHFTCEHCKKTLEGWYRGEKRAMKFAIPRIWQEPTDHSSNCYFCMVDPSKRRTGKNAPAITYPDLPSSIAPVPHCYELPIPTPPEREQPSLEESSKSESEEDIADPDDNFRGGAEERNPYYPNQKDLNALIRDLGLTKSNAELLTSRLKQWNLLDESVQVTDQRKRHQPFSSFFTHQDGLCFCHSVTSLFEAIGIACNQNEWRLFIDSSSRSLKAVLLHNGNKFPSLPLAHSVHLKEEYNSIKTLLDALKYNEYGWEVIGDFKMVAFLMGLQGGFTKFPCYLCLWDSRDTKAHYHRRDWPQWTEFSVGRNNVKWEPLVDPRKVLMPPLHIKLGLMKQFVRALDKESAAFKYLQDFFPKLSEAKVKAGVFVGPQIKKILECNEFPKKLTSKEKAAWNSFVAVVRGFLGNHKAENYVELVETLVKNYGTMGCRMSLKVHILDAHLDKFKENMGAYSEEQGERFHQDILDFERRYQGQYNENMMGDYIWGLIRESDLQYNRKSRKTTHF
ncbi:uncharacterized protein LOC127440312 [Myxocyprinus asiaticus]|uniref:uncharacterized protein LOC127440312 n=1 Tax=Myxocyprinus asiaticus TaxID=70543 RepID=UPI002222E101|nr:uncharacterized protein LOC127440312 [Myxocyprinus asiaticus]XP_051552788.1 uncharacterized protein LOC127440312 [Myxocyprinus asiaticus]